MALRDFLRCVLGSKDDDWSGVADGEPPSAPALAVTPFVSAHGTPELPGNWTIKIRKVADGWSLFIDAPHGAQPLAGLDPALRPLLARLSDGSELPFVCRLLAGRPNNVLNMVAVRLGDDVAVLERVANQLPDEVVQLNPTLVVARFWERAATHDEVGALADFNRLLAADARGCHNFWKKLSSAAQGSTTPALKAWLETRVYGPEDLEGDEPRDDAEDPSMSHPRFLHCNELYTLPVELWPQRALEAALRVARQTGSLAFFPKLTADVLLDESQRRLQLEA